MLSTLAVRKGAPNLANFLKVVAAIPKRACSTAVATTEDQQLLPNEDLIPHHKPYPVTIEEQLKHWDDANELFFGKDRDLKNFPHPEYQVEAPALNFGMVPTSWCKNVYEKLGVSGVYTLAWGSVFALMSKEWLLFDSHGYEFFVRTLVFTWFLAKVGPILKKQFDGIIADERRECYEEPLEKAKIACSNNIEVAKNAIWRMEAVGDIYAAKKEMVDLQLESVYRERINQVHKEVKGKLDYQVDMSNLQRTFQQANMVDWIVESVQGSISPQMEKENIKSCIANLSVLAKQQA